MKKLLFLCLFGLCSTMILAQNANLQDVVYLKNGSIIKGTIIEQVPNESLKIETRDGNVFVYKITEISKITKEANNQTSTQRQWQSRRQNHNQPFQELRFQAKSKAYMGMVEAGYGFGVGDWAADRFNVNIINGYQFNPYLAIGLGVGFRYYSYEYYSGGYYGTYYTKAHDYTVPIFAHIRANFLNRGVSPFVAVNLGYNVSISGGFFGGFMFEPTLGAAFRISNRNSMTFGISYTMDRVKYSYGSSYYGYYEDKAMGGAINLKVGFTF